MRDLLPLLPRPSRYAGIEDGAVRKQPDAVRLRVALAFPDLYEVAMSYLGQKILYGIVNAREAWWAERVMAPDRACAAILREHGAPLCTLESDTPLARMDCVAFSITHELCYTNVLFMLDLAGIPLRHADRPDDLGACPLVMAGGGALLGAEPLAPFMDLMVLGDGEETLPEVLELLERARAESWGRARFLEAARHIPGVYVPSFFSEGPDGRLKPRFADHARPARRIVADLEAAIYPARQVIPAGAVHNRLSLEIARGCTRGCRFCHAGMVYRPVRERSPESVGALLEACLRETGFEEISFLSLSTGDYSALKTLCESTLERCAREQVVLSLPSLRVGSIDDEIMGRMAELRRTGVTLAPEAGSQRLRDVINKGISEEDILLHAQKLLEHGWRQVKLYFMIGLPTETDEDLVAIAELCRKVRDAGARGAPRLQVTASLSPFVPKPFTPFQWEAQIGLEEIDRRVRLVREQFKGQKCLKLRWHEPAMSHLEGILSRAGREMADVVELAWRKGALFDSWMESFDIAPWLAALKECGIAAAECIGARVPGAPLPWSHLEAGVSEDFLLRERERALAGKVTPDCRYGACRHCGACDTAAGPSLLAAPAQKEGEDASRRNRLVFSRRDQAAHQPRRDAEGRLICKTQRQEPPHLAPELVHKAAEYRFWHTKTGGSACLSQLELQATLERALRRAGLPLAFSRGFHPLPLLSFGRALPVGVESEAEW
ncbi:MAG: TIGR03960 family B12-binding radical SAM protein, partial [Desulfovibrio sp.]|nr:TIGR03960 family B12-binding radical SAM protein [Desulfovibrio sp.]